MVTEYVKIKTRHKYKYGMYPKKKKIIYICVCVCVRARTFRLLEADSQKKKRLLEADPYLSIVSQKKKRNLSIVNVIKT